ncbi:winged helix-turn-helix domain-containing protein [Bradyrhizobium sp. CB82]|uniref:winged helix-turn-helix domain-containing protein n=1 Tax=Bradyrhizobium sp. CB82 TaxID=3039159 RepID=UPI0024B1852F|nr:winged helix-turn-helix domain-containing protein [Bradyrhizobium sp. CB82]WFU39135.1 winged helix-turn-helix domain-containing protein [Bradyrhizobium sp. CB82]
MEERVLQSIPEISSRVRNVFRFGPFNLSVAERVLKRGEEVLSIGGRAFDLLSVLVERAGEVISHKELIARAWPDVTVEEANLRVHISALRKVLGDGLDGARYISNVAGRGYCFVMAVARTPPQPAGTDIASRTHNLPARLATMLGLDQTVRQLLAKLSAGRFVSIVGPAGVGKTMVAIAIAHTLFAEFDGAVFFVHLGALAESRLVSIAVASALGSVGRAEDPFHRLLDFLGDRKALLVLDNCDHHVDAVAQLVERVLNEAPQTRILVTTREALRAKDEHVHMLLALETAPDDPGLRAAEALRYPAVHY